MQRLQRRELRLAELVEAERGREVFESMLAEVVKCERTLLEQRNGRR